MGTDLMLASAWARGAITFLFVAVCTLLIVVILLQKGRGGGLAGAFGGAGGHSAFGAKTGDVFTWITVALTAMFIVVACIGKFTFVPDNPVEAATPVVGTAEEAGTTGESAEDAADGSTEDAATTQPGQ